MKKAIRCIFLKFHIDVKDSASTKQWRASRLTGPSDLSLFLSMTLWGFNFW